MNMGIGAMGPYMNRACATIGRTWQFMTKNLGGSMPGTTYMGTLGQNYNYTSPVFGEFEEQLPPGWVPYSVEAGFKPTDNVLTVFTGWSFLNFGAYKAEKYSVTMARMVPYTCEMSGTGGHFTPDVSIHSVLSVIMDPTVAKVVQQTEGFQTKAQLGEYIWKNSFFTMWNYWQALPTNLKKAKEGVEPYASMLKLADGVPSPEPVLTKPATIVVTGGGTNPYWTQTDGGPNPLIESNVIYLVLISLLPVRTAYNSSRYSLIYSSTASDG